MIYLDHAATTPVPREVADAMYEVLTEQFGNPSSQYAAGQDMKKKVEGWRRTVASAIGCEPKQLYFTSCGTESDNWAIQAALWQNRHLKIFCLKVIRCFLHIHRNHKLADHLIVACLANIKMMDFSVFFRKIVPCVVDQNCALPDNSVFDCQTFSALVADN